MRPLLELQRIDSTMDRLRSRRANLPEQQQLDEVAAQRDEVAAQNAEKQTELDQVVREQNRLEADISQIDSKIQHEQARLYSGEVTSPKELSGIQAELDALRRRKTHLEDQELEVMERRETLEGEAGEIGKALAELEAGVADLTSKRDTATIEIDRELGDLGAQRDALAPTIEAELIEIYEDLRPKKGGVAVAALENGVCRACSLPLSPVARDAIKRSDDPFIRCENCRRYLVPV